MAYTTETIFTINSDESQSEWVVKIADTMKKQPEKKYSDVEVIIFRVPDSISSAKPEAFTPQLLGLGPYHHLQPNLYEMEHFKLAVAREACKNAQFGPPEFEFLREEIQKLLPKIKHSYRGSFCLNDKTLASVIAVDGLFVLHTLNVHANRKEGEKINMPEMSGYVDRSGRKLAMDAILRDLLMLENQIPMFVLREILSSNSSHVDTTNQSSDKLLRSMLVGFCEKVSPIKLKWSCEWLLDSNLSIVEDHHHLLDLLLQAITYRADLEAVEKLCGQGKYYYDDCRIPSFSTEMTRHKTTFTKLTDLLGEMNSRLAKILKALLNLVPNIFSVFGFAFFAFFHEKKVLIPTVSRLVLADTRFCATEGGTRFVRFDEETRTLHLPVIVLTKSSEVVMRNLVAYEAMDKSESLSFKRFTELMSAIVDTTEDVQVLRRCGVLKSELTEAEIVETFDGMVKSMESKDMIIDEAISKTNKYYHNTRKVKLYRLLKKYIYSSWKMLTVFASFMLLLLMGLQSFCQIYSCPSMFGTIKKP